MKKFKRVLALIGVVILVGLYLSTLFCAIFATENMMNMLMASIYASVIIPLLIWIYSFICSKFKKDEDGETNNN